MKKLIAILCMIFGVSSFAQTQISVIEENRPMSKGTHPSFQIDVPEANLKQVKKDWLKYIGHGTNERDTEIEGEIIQMAAVKSNISPNPFNIYSKLVETTEFVRLTVWFTEDNKTFLSTVLNNDQSLAVRKYLYDFGIQEYKDVVGKQLKLEQDKATDLDKEMAGLVKSEEKSWANIEDYKRSIITANDNIKINNSDIKAISIKITDQKAMVDKTASDPNANKGAKKTLKDLESQKEDFFKSNEKNGENIDDWNKKIREEERNMAASVDLESIKLTEISVQKDKVLQLQNKMDLIQ